MGKMNRRKFLKASAMTGGALIAGNLLGGKSPVAYGAGKTIKLDKTRIPVAMEVDVVVVGGGPAGFGAATRAAQNGADTVLIERFGGPGGNMTSGFMCTRSSAQPGLDAEMINRLSKEGQIFNVLTRYPDLAGKPAYDGSRQYNFYPDMGALVMLQMMEEANVKFLFRTQFVDTIVQDSIYGDNSIEAVIVENASGRQAIRGKVFVDATGRGDVIERAGAPFMRPGEDLEFGLPIPSSLMWKMSGIDFQRLIDYLKTDPALAQAIAQARANGDIPDELFRPRPVNTYGTRYKGHDTIDMCPMAVPGDALMEVSIPYQWGLNIVESGADASRAEVEMRKFILAEWHFMKKYVPGFENAYITGIAPLLGIRDSRRPVGEYTITYEDMINNRKFPDGVIKRSGTDPLDFTSSTKRTVNFDIPYRAFLPQKINNLLVTGDCLSFTDEIRINILKSIPLSELTGEVAGVSAAMAVEQGISAKEVKWTSYYTP